MDGWYMYHQHIAMGWYGTFHSARNPTGGLQWLNSGLVKVGLKV